MTNIHVFILYNVHDNWMLHTIMLVNLKKIISLRNVPGVLKRKQTRKNIFGGGGAKIFFPY